MLKVKPAAGVEKARLPRSCSSPGHSSTAAPAAEALDPTAEYTPYFSKDTGYTIWLNKKNPRNSYYEYPDKKKK